MFQFLKQHKRWAIAIDFELNISSYPQIYKSDITFTQADSAPVSISSQILHQQIWCQNGDMGPVTRIWRCRRNAGVLWMGGV